MNARETVLNQLKQIETTEVPYTLEFEQDIAADMDKYYGGQEWKKEIKKFIDFPFPLNTIGEKKIDDLHSKDYYGSVWKIYKNISHIVKPALSEPNFNNYKMPDLDVFLEPLEKACLKQNAVKMMKENKERAQFISMGWGIFEASWRIRSFEDALCDMLTEPDFYEELIGRLTELYVGMVKYCADLPADAIVLGDDWGDQRGLIMGSDLWRKFIKPAWKKVYDEIHKQGKFVISHSCGSVSEIMPDMIEIGLDMLESCQPEAANMNPYENKAKFGGKLGFWGALGNQSTIQFGTPAEIKAEVVKLKREMSKGGGYILAPAKSVQNGTPLENAIAVFEAFTQKV